MIESPLIGGAHASNSVLRGDEPCYIAGPNGETDWITADPDFDFGAIYAQFDTLLVGRKTFEPMAAAGRATAPGMKTIVFSRTLAPHDHPDVDIVAERLFESVAEIKAKPGKDIWLFGGGTLFCTLAEAKMVDTVEVSIVPVLLGAGLPLAPVPGQRIGLALKNHKVYRSGVVSLEYAIV